jgi:hypothetical protein
MKVKGYSEFALNTGLTREERRKLRKRWGRLTLKERERLEVELAKRIVDK